VSPPDPDLLCADAPLLAQALTTAGWSAPALDELLGGTARGHLDRGELAPLLRRTGGGSPLETLVRLFVLGVPVPLSKSRRAGVPETWLRPDGYGVAAPVRLQPVLHDGVERLVAHDPSRAAGNAPQPDQVLGLGAASRTLAAATPRTPVGRTLDLGTGCGVQALLAAGHSSTVVATDVNPRAAGYARLGAALNGSHLVVRTGDLLEPVAGELFDLVVSNPPFVLGAGGDGGVRYTYRDAGPEGDELCRRLVAGLPAVLVEGGTAVLLASWLHVEGEDGDDRVRSWFGPGVDGWVVQRELAAPQDYVATWLRDSGEPEGFEQLYGRWLDWFAERRVEAVAFGVLALRKRRAAGGRVWLDEVSQQIAPAWGEQVPAFFAGQDALDRGVLATAWRLREDVRLHSVAQRTQEGWQTSAQVLRQEGGLRWSGGVDSYGAMLLAGCDGTRRLGELLAVLAASAGIREDEAAEQVVPVVQRLVEQGFLVP